MKQPHDDGAETGEKEHVAIVTTGLFTKFQRGAIVVSFIGAGLGIVAHGTAYLKEQETKGHTQAVFEGRMNTVEEGEVRTDRILEQLDTNYVRRSEMNERDKRETDRDARMERLERTMDSIDNAITRLATERR